MSIKQNQPPLVDEINWLLGDPAKARHCDVFLDGTLKFQVVRARLHEGRLQGKTLSTGDWIDIPVEARLEVL
jgi:hypothetical protein